ncbi:hypothetical protein B0A49_02859 [Cryomyces minteri]|uniref:Alpha/beta hydrolase fold-3 domain-containing protein n=1 Tax=Cryomyces minteri TaxID=331657 RepID=A0A4U0XE00_9PEZI|nr:hypothetical protein B0A49_02859 [Cryomyces minteri]
MVGQDTLHLADVNPEYEQLLQAMGGKAPDLGAFPDVYTLRTFIVEAKKNMTATIGKPEGVKEEDIQVPMRDGAEITVRVYSPEKPPSGGSPLIVMFHGGGFVLGGLENEELNCRLFCERLGFVALNVDYRLAPEHVFPTPVNDCWDALKWAAAHASELNADPSKGFVVGGISAGGNMAAVCGHLARDEKLSPPLTGLFLSIPALLPKEAVPEKYKSKYLSLEQNKNAAILSERAIDLFTSNYKPDPASPLWVPFLWPTGHAHLPPTFFQICGQDPFRDEGLLFEEILREECGVKTKLDVYPGLPHSFWSLFPSMEVSRRCVEDTVRGVGWLLEQVKGR